MQIIHTLQEWWQHQTWQELTGVITGLLCVYLAAKNNIWNWPFAIVSVTIYIFIFFEAHLFADMGLQVYFLAMNIYGWYYWSHKPANENKTPVTRISPKAIMLSAAAIVIATFILGSVLKYTTASYPYIDSFCAACSLVAQVFLARKVLENWLIWIFVDVIYVGVYLFKGLHLTAGMYAVYVAIALMGYIDWKKDLLKEAQI
ncbi:nicotinamide riboside transporter PnuC [Mucilaginibacter phyllosphaerae]|uniref:Nicotinamide riboside transporter PnuC n=1 Tax=Mucilaginibacter phyllosphaerae TaxID=1812349 RepID=A0A4Y8A5Z1_9SPHI|nr:nicotinamide riboside transporter PnuC [Mucilaginibacter phyllosphaerae]MBB3971026.1 nicotinamide mononucleotide transporter [Mucilaginibacter phyllosphaerae]TEW63769.1 nicotinamide riboside transporter PnuC [Mucilaginibacter phyllosphaerae]GGH22033.1 putative nicotinamide mononucleotide transporter [Mucilaginibacter phyllosphaerae]